MKKIILLLLFMYVGQFVAAQFRFGFDQSVYKGFKINKNNKDEFPDLIDIHIDVLPTKRIYVITDSNKTPLDGCYHIIVHNNKYIIAHLSKGILNGEWLLYWWEDQLAEKINYKNGIPDGEMHLTYGEHDVITYKEGVRQHYISHHKNGQLKTEVHYENGKMQGQVKEYDEEGKLLNEAFYQDGELNGCYMQLYQNDYVTKTNYNKGKLFGEYVAIWGNGKTAEKGAYDENGEKTGRWVKYDEEGRLNEDEGYLHGKYHGERRSYSNGELSLFEEYDQGQYHGKSITYYSGGKVKREEENYTHGVLNGPTKYYGSNGIVYKEIEYNDGDKMNIKDFDYETGLIVMESSYRNERVVKEKKYRNGKLILLRLANENGSLVDVQEYNQSGQIVRTNKEYKKPESFTLKVDPSGVIDIE